MVPAYLFFFLNPMTRNLFGSSSCARFWKERLRNLLCALCLLARLRLTRMFLVFPCQALRHVCRVPMSATFSVLPTSVGLKLGGSGIRAIRRNRPTSVFSRFDPDGFRPRLFCRLLYQGCCYRGATCTFAHSRDELHSDAVSSQVELALEVDADGTS